MSDTQIFRGKYRIASARNPMWDYRSNAAYFVTMCTHDRIPHFGYIRNGIVCISDVGSIIHQCWAAIPSHFPYVTLDAYIVMPDHVHGIIMIGERPRVAVETPYMASLQPTLQPTPNPHHRPEWRAGCLGSIIQQFKRACTHQIRNTGYSYFQWQPRFHDRIIRDNDALHTVRRYIAENPRRWLEDMQRNT